MLCIEINENQHKNYIKYDENMRYENLFMDFSGKYIFVKYNPNKSIDKYNTSKNTFFKKRMDLLKYNIEKHIHRIEHGSNTYAIETHNLVYNVN